jgi:hypothetical protein
MSSPPLFGSPLQTLKLLAQCLLASISLIVLIGGAIFLLVHLGHVGLAQ